MVKENIYIPKENIAKVEEVRYLENKDLTQQSEQQQNPTITESVKEAVVPKVHAVGSIEETKEGGKQILGAELAVADKVAPPVGVAASIFGFIGGIAAEGVGKMTGNEELKAIGEICKEAPIQPAKDFKKLFE